MHDAAAFSTVSAASPRDYVLLLKPRVMSLVIFTALVGMVAAPGAVDPALGAISLLAIAIGAGASGALNMWWDADIDAVMTRTMGRPIPRGVIDRASAGAFGVILAAFSVVLLWLASNVLAAGLLAFTIFFYVIIYSVWLKRSTPQNIVIGGAAGALPPVVGWAAVTGSLAIEPLVMFAIIFMWTPPHFWALALFREGDYARAGVPMLPVVRGEKETRRQIFAYSLVMAAVGVCPVFFDFAGWLYGAASLALGAGFVWLAWRVLRAKEGDQKPARRLFAYSIVYLFALFLALLVDAGLIHA